MESFLGNKNVDNILMSRLSNFPVLLFAGILIRVHTVPDHFKMISVRYQNWLVWRLLLCRWEVLIRRVKWLASQEGKSKSPDQADLQPFSFSGVCNFILNIHRVPPSLLLKINFNWHLHHFILFSINITLYILSSNKLEFGYPSPSSNVLLCAAPGELLNCLPIVHRAVSECS